jgi:RNA polymerase sigma-70 factor (ECF subfamily)
MGTESTASVYRSSGRSKEVALDDRSDLSLVDAARRGDTAAYETLVRRYQDVAFRTAYVITGNAADAEDVAQNAFLKAWSALDRFSADTSRDTGRFRRRFGREAPLESGDPLSFRPWLLTIVANEARNARRSRSRRPETDLAPLDLVLIDPDSNAPEEILAAQELQDALVQALNRLSREDRVVIQLRYILGLSEADMAAALDIPRGTVKSRLSRALQRARAAIEASGMVMEEQEHRRG